MTDYMKIDWVDVCEGDVLMHENGDRLTVTDKSHGWVTVNGPTAGYVGWALNGFTPHRKIEPVPTEQGAYHDKDGVLCVLMPRFDGDRYSWMIAPEGTVQYWTTGEEEDIVGRGPFTRLVPMPTEEDLTEAVDRDPELSWMGRGNCKSVATTVLALLGGGDDA